MAHARSAALFLRHRITLELVWLCPNFAYLISPEIQQENEMRARAHAGRRTGIVRLRLACIAVAALLGTACRQDGKEGRTVEATKFASDGVVADSGAASMRIGDYRLTRDRLDGWRGAQHAVDRIPDDTSFLPLHAANATGADVDRAVAYLSSRPDLRRAIEQSGLSVRDYVLTTLALARAVQARAGSGAAEYSALSVEDRALLPRYSDDLRRARRAHGFHVVEYGDDDESDDDDEGEEERWVAGGRDRGHHHYRRGHERDE